MISEEIFRSFPFMINEETSISHNLQYFLVFYRCIAVFKPLWYQRFCTPKQVNILLVIVYIFAVLVVIPDMIFTR